MRGENHFARIGRTLGEHHVYNLRNDVARAADHNLIANAQAETLDLIRVVQGRVAHHRARHQNRLQTRYRRHGAGTAYLKFHVAHERHLFLRRKLERHCPARRARHKTEAFLQRLRVDFDHHAVDIETQIGTRLFYIPVKRQRLFRALYQPDPVADRQSPGFKLLQSRIVAAREFPPFQQAEAVAEKGQRALRSDARVELTQGASSGVARVGEDLAVGATRFGIELFKAALRHKDFAAHFQPRRKIIALQAQRNRADGANVSGDVLSRGAVAAGCGARQQAIFIEQAYRQAIQLQFAAVGDIVTAFQAILHALVEGEETGFVKGIVQRQHRHLMAHLFKYRQRRRTNALGRRIGRNEIGMLLFQRAQFAHQAVIFGVRYLGRVHNVIKIFMMAQRGAQFGDLVLNGFHIAPSDKKPPTGGGLVNQD